MSAEDDALAAAEARTAWLVGRMAKVKGERDQYRDWFERLLAVAWRSDDAALRAELATLQGEHDRVVNARSRHNRERGEVTRRKILEARDAGKTIAATARDLELSTSYVARVRGRAKRPVA